MKPASSLALGEQISTYGNAFVQFSNSVGRQRSGTGSQMKRGFGADGFMDFRARRMDVTSVMQRLGLHTIWKDFENRS